MNTEIAGHEDELENAAGLVAQPLAWMQRIEQHSEWPLVSRLPIRLAAVVPIPRFRVVNLLKLAVGQVIESSWSTAQDITLKVGNVQLFWSEFEVVEQRMAVRLTRLA
jgi:flagellar motor switch protein FliM